MKHNPRLNEKMARLPGFSDVHPLQPVDTVQGALEVIHQLAHWLVTLTGMTSVAMSPKAGAHGELCGILAIKAALEKRGEGHRKVIWSPDRRTAPTRRRRPLRGSRSRISPRPPMAASIPQRSKRGWARTWRA